MYISLQTEWCCRIVSYAHLSLPLHHCGAVRLIYYTGFYGLELLNHRQKKQVSRERKVITGSLSTYNDSVGHRKCGGWK